MSRFRSDALEKSLQSNAYKQFILDRLPGFKVYLVLVYYYTGVYDVTVTKWNFQIGLDLPFKGCRSRKTACKAVTIGWFF